MKSATVHSAAPKNEEGAAAPKEPTAEKLPTIEPHTSIQLENPVSPASLEQLEQNARKIAAPPTKDGRPWMWLLLAAVLAIIVALIAWLVG